MVEKKGRVEARSPAPRPFGVKEMGFQPPLFFFLFSFVLVFQLANLVFGKNILSTV